MWHYSPTTAILSAHLTLVAFADPPLPSEMHRSPPRATFSKFVCACTQRILAPVFGSRGSHHRCPVGSIRAPSDIEVGLLYVGSKKEQPSGAFVNVPCDAETGTTLP